MTAGQPIASQPVGAAAQRILPSEWGGPDPGAGPPAARTIRPGADGGRRMRVRKP